MFDRFTEKAVKVILLAQEEARRVGCRVVGTEMILLGLIRENTGAAAMVLKELGADYRTMRAEACAIRGYGAWTDVSERPFTHRAQSAIERASTESEYYPNKLVDTGHLLYGLICDAEEIAEHGTKCLAHLLLDSQGIDLANLKFKLLSLISFSAPKELAPPTVSRIRSSSGESALLSQFSDSAISVILKAEAEATELKHSSIDVTHILLGLMSAQVDSFTDSTGIMRKAREEVERVAGSDARVTAATDLPFSVTARELLLQSWHRARSVGDKKNIKSADILLSLIQQADPVIVEILDNLGFTPDDIQVQALLRQKPPPVVPSLPSTDILQHPSSGTPIVHSAAQEARRLGDNFVWTEQLLVAVMADLNSTSATMLRARGMHLASARKLVEGIIGRGTGFVAAEISFTPRAQRVLSLAWEKARSLGHDFIGTDHIMVALLCEKDGVAKRVLLLHGIDPDELLPELLKRLTKKSS